MNEITKDDKAILQYLMRDDALSENKGVTQYQYIANSDGSIRWIYPNSIKKAFFLNFYSTSSLRAKVFAYLIKIAFSLGLSNRVKSGDLQLLVADDSLLNTILKKHNYIGYSIFTGTAGENRKVIIELHDNKDSFVFVKVALKESSRELIRNEIVKLTYLNSFDFSHLVIPKIIDSNDDDGIVELTNIKPYKFQQSSKLTQLHVNALSELYSHSFSKTTWGELHSLQGCKLQVDELLRNYNNVNSLEKNRVHKLCQQLLLLIELMYDDDTVIPVSISHGDFTPWNMYNFNNTLYLFDWELSQRKIPLMSDLIHFVFQSEIMINRGGYKEIKTEIEAILKFKNVQVLIKNYGINFNKHYLFYLVQTISYYLNKYIKQQNLHEQVFWLLDSWEDAVADTLNKKGVVFN